MLNYQRQKNVKPAWICSICQEGGVSLSWTRQFEMRFDLDEMCRCKQDKGECVYLEYNTCMCVYIYIFICIIYNIEYIYTYVYVIDYNIAFIIYKLEFGPWIPPWDSRHLTRPINGYKRLTTKSARDQFLDFFSCRWSIMFSSKFQFKWGKQWNIYIYIYGAIYIYIIYKSHQTSIYTLQ